MIREFAFGFSNRHYFQDTHNQTKWQNVAEDTFMSLYAYDDEVNKYFEKNKTLAGFEGKIYMPDEFLLDVDGTSIEVARKKAISLCELFRMKGIPNNAYFSGRGFHIGIPHTAFKWEPSKDLHLKVKDALASDGIYEFADPSVTDKTRIIRLINTLNTRSGLWKIYLTEDELYELDEMEIESLAKKPRKDKTPEDLQCEAHYDVLVREKKKSSVKYKAELGMNPDPTNYPCIQTMLEGTGYGSRHAYALRISSWLRWRYPEHVVRLIMEDWRQRVDTDKDHSFKKSEMDKIVTDCYTGHNGSGYRYGCLDTYMDKHCASTCKIYKAKKSNGLMSPQQMETNLVNFFRSTVRPMDLGEMYGEPFPIYPGELVIIQAPPKSMKTTMIQNWINHFKKPTYFLEMEMSPRQIWTRFVMIEKGWTEEQIKNHYLETGNGVSNNFDWLFVDYAPCYAVEINKRIDMLPTKPEIVVIDHMGLLNSKYNDLNMKMEEISGALTDIAIKNNLVVFVICEITKQAMTEGMNISSVRGSFRIAYNASKVLSITPKKSEGEIVALHLKTTANRERGNIDKLLKVNNLKITAS